MKVMLKLLNRNNETALVGQVKGIIARCSAGHRAGDPTYSPLQNAVIFRLQLIPGIAQYCQLAKSYMSGRVEVAV